jgi:hypothetical protein
VKIGIIGNMNNANFSLLRYLRDLGLEAQLLLYSDEIDHFKPECDTWDFEKWKPYIQQMDLPNGNLLNYLRASSSSIRRQLAGFDFYIGTGFAPAYFYKAQLTLDIYIPYAVGIEFVYEDSYKLNFKSLREVTKSLFWLLYRSCQIRGLRNNTRLGLSMDESCLRMFSKFGVSAQPYGLVAIYNNEDVPPIEKDKLQIYTKRMNDSELVLYSHVSHYWNTPKLHDIKRNYILIEGFAKYVKMSNLENPVLVLHEYGPDVDLSKQLIRKMGIEQYVLWLPKMLRKEIMLLLDYVDIGGSEFGGIMWGGTGWEFLSKGIPFFHYLNLTNEEFEIKYGIPIPSILNVGTSEGICQHLLDFERDQQKYGAIGASCKEWFNKYNGISLAKKYKDLIITLYDEKTSRLDSLNLRETKERK